MTKFYLNLNQQLPKDGGNFEIHRDDKNCVWLKELLNNGRAGVDYKDLGNFFAEQDAYRAARTYALNNNNYYMYNRIDGCKTCCKEINKWIVNTKLYKLNENTIDF